MAIALLLFLFFYELRKQMNSLIKYNSIKWVATGEWEASTSIVQMNPNKTTKKWHFFICTHLLSKKIGNIWNRKSIEGEGEIKTVGQCRRENLCVWVKHRQNKTYSTKFFFFLNHKIFRETADIKFKKKTSAGSANFFFFLLFL
jgi:hypothetical protein